MAGAVWKPRRGSKSKKKRDAAVPGRTDTRLGVIVGGSRFGRPNGELLHSLDLLDLDQERGDVEPARILLDFLAHGFAPHPKRAREAALFEKRGPGACYVDLVEGRVIQTIAPLDNHAFYGHGTFTRGGDVVLAVETNLATRAGVISVRDGESFAPLDRFPTYGVRPHDCVLVDEGRTLAITNGGGDIDADGDVPCVTFVDIASRKLLERFDVESPRINTGHIAFAGRREFAVVSAPRDGLPEDTTPGGLSLRVGNGALAQVKQPEDVMARMLGETLSVCVDKQRGIVAATSPRGGLLGFWRLRDGALVRTIELPNVRGVALTLDGRYYVVAYGPSASLALFDVTTFERLESHEPGQRRFSGSHVYAWKRPE